MFLSVFYSVAMKKIRSLLFAVGAVMLPVSAFAQNGTSITVPTDFTGIAWADFVTTLAGALAPALIAMLGLAAGVFLVRYIWRNMKSISR